LKPFGTAEGLHHPGRIFDWKFSTKMNFNVNKIANDTVYYTSTVNGEQWDGRFLIIK
jgi:hypothetical protein